MPSSRFLPGDRTDIRFIIKIEIPGLEVGGNTSNHDPRDSSPGITKIHGLRSTAAVLGQAPQENEEGRVPDTIPEF